jgi:DNA-binding XRE family transcriptional regulator
MSDETTVYRVPADGHGTLFVAAADAPEAFEIAREQGTVADADMTLSIGDSYRDRVREVEDHRRTPINVENAARDDPETPDAIPGFPTVERLRASREAIGVSQRDVAEVMGVSPRTVSHYENGRREISLSNARDYANALHRFAEDE